MISRKFVSLFASLFVLQVPFSLPLLSPQTAFAIPKEDAIAKLNLVTVYVLVNQNDELITAQQGEFSVVNTFLDKQAAQTFLDTLQKSDPLLTAKLKKYSLDKFFPIMEAAQLPSAPDNLLFPIVNIPQNLEKAYEILLDEGIRESEIQQTLRVPVFFTEPMVNMTINSDGNKQFFFLDFEPLALALSKMPSGTPKPKLKVLNLDQVLDVIIKEDNDIYYIYPNKQYLLEQ